MRLIVKISSVTSVIVCDSYSCPLTLKAWAWKFVEERWLMIMLEVELMLRIDWVVIEVR